MVQLVELLLGLDFKEQDFMSGVHPNCLQKSLSRVVLTIDRLHLDFQVQFVDLLSFLALPD